MLLKSATVVDAGVDYFTSTATVPSEARELLVQADKLLWTERRLGFDVSPWSMSGYHGWKCGRLQFGERADGSIVRLSSGLAAAEWFTFWQVSQRCSRIDVQVTLLCDGPVAQEVFALAAQVTTHYAERKDGPALTLISDNLQGATFYIGKRSSSLYFRGYNKEAQSELPEHEKCLRLELEIKSRLTRLYIESLLGAESVKAACLGVIGSYLEARGISPNLLGEYPRSFYERLMPATDRLNSLRWLRSAVRPTVYRLIEDGLLGDALDCLGLTNFVAPIDRGV